MADSGDEGERADPVIEHFVELRKYIEHSHDGLSTRLQRLERKVDAGFGRTEREMRAGFSGVGRKLDALARPRRAAPRRRKP